MDTTLTPQATPPAETPALVPASGQDAFVDRRSGGGEKVGRERRQFTNSYSDLSPDAAELANAIDAYKLRHRRRFINFEEMLEVLTGLGYSK